MQDRAGGKLKSQVEYVSEIAVIRFSGELTIHNAHKVRAQIEGEIVKGYRRIIIELEQVTYMDSTALGMLVAIYKTARNENQKVIIAGVNENLRRLLSLTRLNTFFVVYDTCQEAIEKFIASEI